MSVEVLDQLATSDQRQLDLADLSPILEEVTYESEPDGLFARLMEWLRQRLVDNEIAQNEWLEDFAAWLVRHGDVFEFFFYVSTALIVLAVLYLLWFLFREVGLPKTRRKHDSTATISPVPLALAESNDPVVQAYVELLRHFEHEQWLSRAFTLSPREISDRLERRFNSENYAFDALVFFQKIDGYLYGQRLDYGAELQTEIARMLNVTQHE